MLAKLFNYVVPFKLEEFLASSTAIDRKINFLIKLIKIVKAKDQESRQHALNSKRAGGSQTQLNTAGTASVKSKTKQVNFRQGDDSVAGPSSQSHRTQQ